MINNKRVIALIPARGGSKRLPQKNILPLAGKPLIGWTIEAAKQSSYIDRIIVSTDDSTIADISLLFSAEVPELRPNFLATDEAKTEDVVLHILDKFIEDEEILIILQPTSPLRTSKHIDESLEFFNKKSADAIISVCQCEHSPLWTNTLPENLSMNNFIDKINNVRSQELPNYYRLNGAIYCYSIKEIISQNKLFYNDNTFAYIMEKEHSIDVDDSLDFKYCQFFLENVN